MSKFICENNHLLQTLVDKSLPFSFRQELAKKFPKNALNALREALYNTAVGHVEGFPAEVTELLSTNRQLVFKIVDINETLSVSQRRNLSSQQHVLKLLDQVLPTILEKLLEAQEEVLSDDE